MIDKTVLILGAGASCHYGFPTGEALIKQVCTEANRFDAIIKEDERDRGVYRIDSQRMTFQDVSNLYHGTQLLPVPGHHENENRKKEAKDLKQRIENIFHKIKSLDPLNIDTFLRDNPSLQDVGTFLIALVLLRCEVVCKATPENDYNKDKKQEPNNWYRFLIHVLAVCENSEELKKVFLNEQKLSIITFNYDVSLEYHLYNSLKKIEKFQHDARDFMKEFSEKCIFHVYGALHQIDWNADDPFADFGLSDSTNDELLIKIKLAIKCSKNIRTIYGRKSVPEDPEWEEKRQKMIRHIHDSIRLVILGYGFDGENTRLLSGGGNIKGLKGWLDGDYYGAKNRLLLTNFNNSKRIEAKITKHERCSISTEKVYNALMHDFDLV